MKKVLKKLISLVACAVMLTGIFSLLPATGNTVYAKAISAEDMARKFNELKSKYPEGSYWNKAYVVGGREMSWQCMGWAETVCDYLFGENPRNWPQQTKWDNMCVGDHVRLYYKGEPNNHSIVITDMVGDTVYYADCNGSGDGRVHWDKSMKKSQLISKAVWFKSQNDNWVRTLSGAGNSQPQQSSGGELYNFACAAGGRYLNVYAGNDWDGANVCVWDADNSKEQNFKADNRGGTKYAFYPQSSNGRVLDANRGNSYNNPLQAGNNIDLWRTNDAPAQEWYICDRGDGKYSIELASNRNLVIGCDDPWANNGNCSLQSYNGSDSQLWYIKRNGGGVVNIKTEGAPALAVQPEPVTQPEPEINQPEEYQEPTLQEGDEEHNEDTLVGNDDNSNNDYDANYDNNDANDDNNDNNDNDDTYDNYDNNHDENYNDENNDSDENGEYSNPQDEQPPRNTAENQIILTIGDTRAVVFGEVRYNDVPPVLQNGRTMLPARFVAESLGAWVGWDEDTRAVTIENGDTSILLFVNSDKAYVNGKVQYLDSPAFTQNDRTYTPVRFIVEALGCDVDWDEYTQRIIITRR